MAAAALAFLMNMFCTSGREDYIRTGVGSVCRMQTGMAGYLLKTEGRIIRG